MAYLTISETQQMVSTSNMLVCGECCYTIQGVVLHAYEVVECEILGPGNGESTRAGERDTGSGS
jgi:hypothetical protein